MTHYVISEAQNAKRIVCYYDSFANNRSGWPSFLPENIDPFLCTNVVVLYADLSNNTLATIDPGHLSTIWSRGLFEKCTDLKNKNPALLISLSFKGKSDDIIDN